MENSDQLYQIAFSQLHGIGPVRARRILKLLAHPRDFFDFNLAALQQITSIPITQLEKTDRSGALLRAQGQLPYFEKENFSYHFITDSSYPSRLKQCDDAPLGLFYRGAQTDWQKLQQHKHGDEGQHWPHLLTYHSRNTHPLPISKDTEKGTLTTCRQIRPKGPPQNLSKNENT
jgi:predicted Rossmann fold nucleotide-binding protein DprA/Smf involved in DNA uptake